jgi:hypothetical protein
MALREVENLAIHRTPTETSLVPARKNLHMIEIFCASEKKTDGRWCFNFGSVFNSPFQNSLQEKNSDKIFFWDSAIMLTA